MGVWSKWRSLVEDPPPRHAFEISQSGIAYARRGQKLEFGYRPLEPDVIQLSPIRDNVLRPAALLDAVAALAPANGGRRRRPAALILPDFCARVAVLDFDSFPTQRQEQESLVRFRLKRTIPFDLESSAVSYYVQGQSRSRQMEVVVAVSPLEIVARYEAPFRAAGFHPGLVTTSTLAALSLQEENGVAVLARLSDAVLTLCVTEARRVKLMRCVELTEFSQAEIMGLLYPTCAYVEDELQQRAEKLVLCGFGEQSAELAGAAAAELGVTVAPLRSRLGEPGQANAGLLGYLESNAERWGQP